MSVISEEKNIGLIKVGTEICVPIMFDTDEDLSGAYVSIDIPQGVVYSREVLPRGSYNSVSNKWNIGIVTADENILSGVVCFTVTDDSYSQYQFTLTGGATGACDGCLQGNSRCITYVGITCSDIFSCIEENSAAPSGYVSLHECNGANDDPSGSAFCRVRFSWDSVCPIGGVNTWVAKIYSLGTIGESAGGTISGTLLATWTGSPGDNWGSAVMVNETAVDIASACSGIFPDAVIDTTFGILPEDIQIRFTEITDSCGTTVGNTIDVIVDMETYNPTYTPN